MGLGDALRAAGLPNGLAVFETLNDFGFVLADLLTGLLAGLLFHLVAAF